MHLPWTQVANEVLDHAAPELAVALAWHEDPEISEALALRGLVQLFRWARERCPNDRPPSAGAIITGSTAGRLIARAMGWRGDPEALVDALERVQPSPIVSRMDGGVLICGLDRYDGAWRKNYRDAAEAWDARVKAAAERIPVGMPTETARKPGAVRAVSDRQTQTQTQTQKEEDPPSRARAGAVAHPPPPALISPAADDLPARMDEIHRRARSRPLEWGPARHRMARERELGDLAAQHGDAELLRRLENALTCPAGKFPYFAEVGDLVRHWGRYAEPLPEEPGRRPKTANEVLGMPPVVPRETPAEAEQRVAAERARREELRRQNPRAAKVVDLAQARAARAPPEAREEALALAALRALPFGERRRIYAEARRLARGNGLTPRARRVARRFHIEALVAAGLGVKAHGLQALADGGTR
ncbi:MAG TPA: hypothetical protein VFP50_15265 [Anaeromyxobacteraceae bacterium]|nr:hypothetical protein [Anaeromyxobacteraceae bacterium]